MTYPYSYQDYVGEVREDGTEAVDPERNVNPSLLVDRERVLLREERNADWLRARVLAELARRNGRGG